MNYRIEGGGPDLLGSIEPLWEELNSLHKKKSLYFKEDYRAFHFETRRQDFTKKSERGSLRVALALDQQNHVIGYYIASILEQDAEIDSIIVSDNYRRRGIGSQLMADCMNWLKNNSVKRIKVGVAYGNEAAFQFYEKFDLFPRITYLASKNWLSG